MANRAELLVLPESQHQHRRQGKSKSDQEARDFREMQRSIKEMLLLELGMEGVTLARCLRGKKKKKVVDLGTT